MAGQNGPLRHDSPRRPERRMLPRRVSLQLPIEADAPKSSGHSVPADCGCCQLWTILCSSRYLGLHMLLFDTLLDGLLALCCNVVTSDWVPICWLAAMLASAARAPCCPRLETSLNIYKQSNYTPGLLSGLLYGTPDSARLSHKKKAPTTTVTWGFRQGDTTCHFGSAMHRA